MLRRIISSTRMQQTVVALRWPRQAPRLHQHRRAAQIAMLFESLSTPEQEKTQPDIGNPRTARTAVTKSQHITKRCLSYK
jgi:hypothetical protein